MSAATHKAIYEALTTSVGLAALLGKDEDGESPAVFNASLNQVLEKRGEDGTGWTYPCITFRESSTRTDPRFHQSVVEAETYDLEIWTDGESTLVVSGIQEQVDAVLHEQVLTLESGECFECRRTTAVPDLFDNQLMLVFGLYQYLVMARR